MFYIFVNIHSLLRSSSVGIQKSTLGCGGKVYLFGKITIADNNFVD